MSSGDSLLVLKAPYGSPPAASMAAFDMIAGASTPGELIPVYDFDASADEYMDFHVVMPESYGGATGITCSVRLSASVATSSNFRVGIALRRIETTDDIDTTSHTYVFNEASFAVPGTVGLAVDGDITFTDGSDMDNVAAGDECIIRVWRNYDHADDAASGDMELRHVHIKET